MVRQRKFVLGSALLLIPLACGGAVLLNGDGAVPDGAVVMAKGASLYTIQVTGVT